MYNGWSPVNTQQGYSHFPPSQRLPDNRVYPYAAASPPMDNYYAHASSGQLSSTQHPPLPRHQPYPTHDPRLTVHQTNQTLTALASARRLSPEYMKESSNLLAPTRDLSPRSHPHYNAQHKHYHSGNGDSSDSVHGVRPVQVTVATSPTPSTTYPTSRTSEGHACSYCGKAFGRPSALKIHLAIHTGERAFICPEAGCHRSFSVRSNMSRHIRNVHQIWPEGNHDDLDSGDEVEDRRSG